MPANDVSEKLHAEIVALRHEVRELSTKLDDVLSLLRGTSEPKDEPKQTQANYFGKPPQDPPAGETSAENWVDLLAKRARGLGLDVPDDKVRHLTTSPPTSPAQTQE